MNTELLYNSEKYTLKRYPETQDASLRAWSNAELLALDYIKDKNCKNIHLYNDRFGVWNCVLNTKSVMSIYTYASQKKAVFQNLKLNNFSTDIDIASPIDKLYNVDLALLKVPKSLELFELFLQQIHKASNNNTEVVCCFMTKHFSKSILKLSSYYFDEIEQSKAWKKARLLILKLPKEKVVYNRTLNSIHYKNDIYKQYLGVFSSDKIDIGTQFLLEHLQIKDKEIRVLDLACGNGVIAKNILFQNTSAKLSLVDDFNLAIESAKLNLQNYSCDYLCDNNLNSFKDNSFDVVVSNPPFHFEHENNIEVSLSLFKQVKRVLVLNGKFILVANKHLNYKTHLQVLFNSVILLSSNNKFVVYECL